MSCKGVNTQYNIHTGIVKTKLHTQARTYCMFCNKQACAVIITFTPSSKSMFKTLSRMIQSDSISTVYTLEHFTQWKNTVTYV